MILSKSKLINRNLLNFNRIIYFPQLPREFKVKYLTFQNLSFIDDILYLLQQNYYKFLF